MAALQMNHSQFTEALAGDKPVLVDFWAPWCVYCRRITDIYEQIALEYGDRIVVAKVNIDEEPGLADQEQIEIIPTLALYQSGKRVSSIIAPESKAAIEAMLGGVLAPKQTESPVYDTLIIGGDPAGYTAALYAVRAGLKALVVEKLSAGGQMAQTQQIDNYPGFEEGIGGWELADQMKKQAERFGAQSLTADVLRLDLAASPKVAETSEGVLKGRTVILATGATPRPLGLAEEQELIGRGVAYCAVCDGMFYRGKTVVVVGGGNTAAEDALHLSRIAQKVILVHRRDSLRADRIYHEPLLKAGNVEFRWNSTVSEILHGDVVTGVRLRSVQTGEESLVDCDGVFVSIGRDPATQLVKDQLRLDEGGYVIAGEDTATSIPGVYAAGDVRAKPLRQVVTAVADGAVAVHMAQEYLA